MSERYDAVAVRKYTDRDGNEQSSFTNVGVAFPFKDKPGYSVKLHCLPAPEAGEYTILLFPPKPRDDARSQGSSKPRASAPPFMGAFDEGMSDDILF